MNLIDLENQYPHKNQKSKIELPSPNQIENSRNVKVAKHFSKEMAVKQNARQP